MAKKIECWIVAADPYIRASITAIIEELPGCRVFRESDPQNAVDNIEEKAHYRDIDVLIWDCGWAPDGLVLPFFRDLEIPVVLLLEDAEFVAQAWASGAMAIVPRLIDRSKLGAVIKAVTRGLLAFDPALTQSLFPSQPLFINHNVEPPTPRELEVLQQLAEGLTNKAIAQRLKISEHTVKFHMNSILGKLNVQSRTEAVVRATQLGLIAL
jgi:DNA-binding NarL/FixJ family response regulator